MTPRIAMPPRARFLAFKGVALGRLERAALAATDGGASEARDDVRAAMRAARLGRLVNVIASGSDLRKRRIKRRGGGRFSASGFIYVRGGRQERTSGAIDAYIDGTVILPKRQRWLWISTSEIPKRVGRFRMTPERYNQSGLATRIGPLVQIPGKHAGEALLIVRDVSVPAAGATGRARRLPKGKLRPTRERRDQIVAFVGIRQTYRAQRVAPRGIFAATAAGLPRRMGAALSGTR